MRQFEEIWLNCFPVAPLTTLYTFKLITGIAGSLLNTLCTRLINVVLCQAVVAHRKTVTPGIAVVFLLNPANCTSTSTWIPGFHGIHPMELGPLSLYPPVMSFNFGRVKQGTRRQMETLTASQSSADRCDSTLI